MLMTCAIDRQHFTVAGPQELYEEDGLQISFKSAGERDLPVLVLIFGLVSGTSRIYSAQAASGNHGAYRNSLARLKYRY